MHVERPTELAAWAQLTGAFATTNEVVEITGARPLDEARAGDITFIDQQDRAATAAASPAAAVVVPTGVVVAGKPCLMCDDVHKVFSQIVTTFQPPAKAVLRSIHPTAIVSPTARLGDDVAIGARVVIGDNTTIGDRTTIHAGTVVGNDCCIGEQTTLMANVSLYDRVRLGSHVIIHSGAVLGGHGFGYRQRAGRHELTAQLGGVEVGDHVEIGANCAIDRGTYSDTRIGEGTKIDNLVQIAHNCQIGRHNLLCSQVGIAGSTTTGDYVVMAGQVGVRDHVRIGDGATIGAMAGVSNDVADGLTVLGAPAIPQRDFKVQTASIAKLPQLRKQMKELAKELQRLQSSIDGVDTTADRAA